MPGVKHLAVSGTKECKYEANLVNRDTRDRNAWLEIDLLVESITYGDDSGIK